jgi:hypothetical protein
LKGKNVEVFATLTGKRSKVGSVAENLGNEGFGKLARPFVPGEVPPVDASIRAGEDRLRQTHRVVCEARMQLHCEPAVSAGTGTWQLSLVPKAPLNLPHSAALDAWPITVSDSHARAAVECLEAGQPVLLASLACADLTAFVAFRLTDIESGQVLVFSSKLPIDGLPADRDTAVLRSFIKNRQAFFGYLRLLLADPAELLTSGLSLSHGPGGGSQGGVGADDMPMLEDLVRAMCRGEQRAFKAIDELMTRVDAHQTEGDDPVPEGFRELWSAFREARRMQGTADAA